ncbi:MAG: phosphodiester glycosidase family protein [Clostridia bacterium]|nr:phosphodiester glycosidase family protein [Clostridia bacterium]
MKLKKILSAVSAAAIIYCSALPALAFTLGEDSGAGEVKETNVESLGHGVTYEDVTVKYTDELDHKMRVVTFDPAKGEVIPLVYSKYSGYGATVPDSASAAEAAGYNVIAAINASFFGLTSTSCNTYGGVCISDGKIMQGSDSFGVTQVLAFMPDGTAALVDSKVTYSFTAEDKELSAPIDCINMTPGFTYDVIYYYDSFCGNKTDTNTLGIEVVFEKTLGSNLTVGGELLGEVVEVRTGVDEGGEIGNDRFVLYAPDTSDYAALLGQLRVGDRITVNAEETVESSRETMENCASALVTYGYVIVRDGKNVTSTNGLGEDYNRKRAQKTAIGIKENGELVFFSSLGREDEHPGITSYELADVLISEGCVTAINLDGGNSAQLVIENEKDELVSVTPILRRVANSLLLVEKKPPTDIKAEFDLALAMAKSYFVTYELGRGREALIAAIDETSHLSRVTASGAEYVRASAKLSNAMDNTEKLKIFEGVYVTFEDTVFLKQAESESEVLCEVPAGESVTVTRFSGDYAFTRYKGFYGWIPVESLMGLGSSENIKLELDSPEVLYRGEDLTVSWNVLPGVCGYSYRVTEYDVLQDGESEGVLLAEAWTVDTNKLKIPSVSRTDGRRIVVEVSADFPLGSITESVTVETSALPFSDVPRDHWGYSSALHAYEKGYITGITADTFAPNVTVTRAMMATLVYRMAGSPEISQDSYHGFSDVESGAWYEAGVIWCRENGIVSGISETEFAPNAPVTREQAACFLMRYASLVGEVNLKGETDLADSFNDAESVSGFAEEAVTWACENGIIKGSYGRLDPLGTADRIQIATVLSNFDSYIMEMNSDKA